MPCRRAAVSSRARVKSKYPAPANEQIAAEEIIADALAEARALGIEAEAMTSAGSPACEIVAAAERVGASMIVMGHRHLSWINQLLNPSMCMVPAGVMLHAGNAWAGRWIFLSEPASKKTQDARLTAANYCSTGWTARRPICTRFQRLIEPISSVR
jgi:hypothetical protein